MTVTSPGRSLISQDSPTGTSAGRALPYSAASRRPPQMRSFRIGSKTNGYNMAEVAEASAARSAAVVQDADPSHDLTRGIDARAISDRQRDVLWATLEFHGPFGAAQHRDPLRIVDQQPERFTAGHHLENQIIALADGVADAPGHRHGQRLRTRAVRREKGRDDRDVSRHARRRAA